MAKGGRRAGAGRKPGPKKAVVLGMDGARRVGFALPAPVVDSTVPDSDGLLVAPADLPASEQLIWAHLAPYAVRERTLSPSKTPGFRRLCKQWAIVQEFDARIAVLGVTTAEADRLVKRLEKWEQRLDASLGNFGLRSFGKPVSAEKPKASMNPWAAVAK